MALFPHLLVPVASEEDARATSAALSPHLDDIRRITAVHVIEKAGGGIDKAPMDKRRADAAAFLSIVDEKIGDRVAVETDAYFGTDTVETLFDAAEETGADAIAFRARGGSRIARLLAGDVSTNLVTDPRVPVISLPNPQR
ncbi:universal stress protein [Halovivax gelatinilyticus]|uniref:universal stress protein n=1 Tax=Halovivax gelatinilyticus TaxID=2961597 RepID=UPI0020CA4A16|nr:universal stress protein [Halovivax gelatinilyticus]